MKSRVLFCLVLCFFMPLAGCSAQENKPVNAMAKRFSKQRTPEGEAKENLSGPYFKNFGLVKEGNIARHVFVFKNDSARPLSITKINTSCGCTASAVKKNTLNPGESTEIEVTFNSKGYTGPVKQYIYVHTDDPEEEVVKLTIKADVVK